MLSDSVTDDDGDIGGGADVVSESSDIPRVRCCRCICPLLRHDGDRLQSSDVRTVL